MVNGPCAHVVTHCTDNDGTAHACCKIDVLLHANGLFHMGKDVVGSAAANGSGAYDRNLSVCLRYARSLVRHNAIRDDCSAAMSSSITNERWSHMQPAPCVRKLPRQAHTPTHSHVTTCCRGCHQLHCRLSRLVPLKRVGENVIMLWTMCDDAEATAMFQATLRSQDFPRRKRTASFRLGGACVRQGQWYLHASH
jgi:hypothetical protein